MKHKVAELEGALLDASVAKAEGMSYVLDRNLIGGELQCKVNTDNMLATDRPWRWDDFGPSEYWEQGGPIIERARISVSNPNGDPGWIGTIAYPSKPKRDGTPQWKHHWELGPTPLIAAMRAYVASRFGPEIEME